jgi:hypothetical protein
MLAILLDDGVQRQCDFKLRTSDRVIALGFSFHTLSFNTFLHQFLPVPTVYIGKVERHRDSETQLQMVTITQPSQIKKASINFPSRRTRSTILLATLYNHQKGNYLGPASMRVRSSPRTRCIWLGYKGGTNVSDCLLTPRSA